MPEIRVAKRYAKSLLDLGNKQNITEQIYSDMKLVLQAVRANRPLAVVFKSPVVGNDKKIQILKSLLQGRMHELTIEFLCIITRKNRERYIEDIATSYISLYKAFKKIQPAVVVTAVPLDENLRKEMTDLVARSTGSTVELKEITDPSILGGFILRWGDRQVDASVGARLHELGYEFSKNYFGKDLLN
jgi:F-type H+-transporting ATPase subunit delta